MQWALFAAWFFFLRWIAWGDGRFLLTAGLYNIHGAFAEELVWTRSIGPYLGLVSLSLLALIAWLQILWLRCFMSVERRGDAWAWRDGRGPATPEIVTRTAGGAWVRSGGRWWLVPSGLVGEEDGEDWIGACGGRREVLAGGRFALSPMVGSLALLLLIAWGFTWPMSKERSLVRQAAESVRDGRREAEEALIRRHPEIRPWIRYLESLKGCDRKACFRSELLDRLECLCIGPAFSGDDTTVLRLLVLHGWHALALRLAGYEGALAFDITLRLDNPSKARSILGKMAGGKWRPTRELNALLLLSEGRYEESYREPQAESERDTQRAISVKATLAHLTGRCPEARRLAALLMAPHSLRQTRLDGAAPTMGLGSLQRAAREIRSHASYSLGRCLLGDLQGAFREWAVALRMADEAGLTGLLDVDKILLRRIAPGGPWGYPAGLSPAIP